MTNVDPLNPINMSQKKYLCILRNDTGGCDDSSASTASATGPSPSEMEAMFAQFNDWRTRFAANIVDLGGRLGDGKVIQADGEVSDGPFTEIKEIVGGFMILTADTLAEAVEVTRLCPAISGAGVEVREILSP